jgi:crossover junction endodeoxyribonuclease RuvC
MWEKDLSFIVVDSRKWKNRVLIGTTKDKQAAIDYCLSKFPDISLLATPRSRKHHDGIADAICISEYARHYAGR